MSLLSSWYEMDVPVELLAYNLWAAENDKTSFLSVEVDIFYPLFFERTTYFLAHGANDYYKTKIW